MAEFRPFRGWRFNPQVVPDLAQALCPPYDLITKELQEELRERSTYNAVRLEAGQRQDWDEAVYNRYDQAAETFRQWRRRETLRRDAAPAYYLLRYRYLYGGQQREQLALLGAARLADYSQRVVLPHEYTWPPAVGDRVALLDACQANISPIMSLCRDAQGVLPPLYQQIMAGPPASFARDAGAEFALWRIDGQEQIASIQHFFAPLQLFLADGHHRYEAALQYQQLQRHRAGGQLDPEAACNFVLMALIEFDNSGLMVLPYHRVIGGLSPEQYAQLQQRLNQLFEALPFNGNAPRDEGELLKAVARSGERRHTVALVGPGGAAPQLLALREGVDWRQWGPLAVSEAWLLEEQVFRPVLGAALPERLRYVHDAEDALAAARGGQAEFAFLLKPFPMSQFEAIVSQGQRLPPKSTFFYPKLPTGLVINPLDGNI